MAEHGIDRQLNGIAGLCARARWQACSGFCWSKVAIGRSCVRFHPDFRVVSVLQDLRIMRHNAIGPVTLRNSIIWEHCLRYSVDGRPRIKRFGFVMVEAAVVDLPNLIK